MPAWTYRPELDGLRSVAVYLVVLFHCGVGPFEGGFIGVDLFFVLSGFLVSHVIWAEVDRSGSFRLGWFYARRVRRLLPAAVLVIVVTAALQLLVASAPQRSGMVRDAQSALVYLSNWHFIADSRDYFAGDAVGASPFLHFWSLSIEEQFYVVLPLALLLLLRLRRHAAVVLLVLTAVVVGLGGSPGLVRGLRPDVRLLRHRDAGLPAGRRGAARDGHPAGDVPGAGRLAARLSSAWSGWWSSAPRSST